VDHLEPNDAVPARVRAAIKFIDVCNKSMGLRFFTDSLGGDVREVAELHHKQEAAFRQACNCLGEYFSGSRHGRRKRSKNGE
jgi:hypothetical protein